MTDIEKEDVQETVQQVQDILEEYWSNSDPLYRMDRVIAAQKRLDSITFSVKHVSQQEVRHQTLIALQKRTEDLISLLQTEYHTSSKHVHLS